MKKSNLRLLCLIMAAVLFANVPMGVLASKKEELQQQKEQDEKELNNVKKQINQYTGAQADLGGEIEELDVEIMNLLTDIDLISQSIEDKQVEIDQTEIEYNDAVDTENRQYESMKIRVKFMYERGDVSYLELFLSSKSLAEAINKSDYVEQLYEYDRKLLLQYQETVALVQALWDQLEEEKSELEVSKAELEDEEAYLNQVMEEKQEEYENYDVMIAKAKQEAAAYSAKIKQETAQIKKIEKEEEEARKRAEEEARKAAAAASSASSGSSSGSYVPAPSGGGGSKGQQIASYACQFIGNPYVSGGTSLTNGADCSGFTQAVYRAFGYSIPRTSYAQANYGTAVSYDSAQPGDIIYYGGHVGIYIGNGQIVHASTERSGIKINSATYRSIVTVRRIV